MIQLEINNRTIGLIEIPEHTKEITLRSTKHYNSSISVYDNFTNKETILVLPPGDYTIIGLGSEISEEQWGKIVEFRGYRENDEEMYLDYTEAIPTIIHTATASGLSLIRFHNLNPETTLLVKIK